MEVTCGHCKKKLNIPDEKIPKDQRVTLSCPKCKNKITIDTRKPEEEKPSPAEPKAKPAQEPEEKGYGYDDFSDDEDLGSFEEDAKLALVMDSDPDNAEKIKGAVEDLDYKHISAPNIRDAIGKLRFHHFDLIILSDGFDGQGVEQSPILNYLNQISMSVRRTIFVAVISDDFKTMDNSMAFAMSVNAVINGQDVEKLSGILRKAVSENERFYKVYMDALVETGRA